MTENEMNFLNDLLQKDILRDTGSAHFQRGQMIPLSICKNLWQQMCLLRN